MLESTTTAVWNALYDIIAHDPDIIELGIQGRRTIPDQTEIIEGQTVWGIGLVRVSEDKFGWDEVEVNGTIANYPHVTQYLTFVLWVRSKAPAPEELENFQMQSVALMDKMKDAIRTDSTLGGLVCTTLLDSTQMEYMIQPDKLEVSLTCRVVCRRDFSEMPEEV